MSFRSGSSGTPSPPPSLDGDEPPDTFRERSSGFSFPGIAAAVGGDERVAKQDYDNLLSSFEGMSALSKRQQSSIEQLRRAVAELKRDKLDFEQSKRQLSAKNEEMSRELKGLRTAKQKYQQKIIQLQSDLKKKKFDDKLAILKKQGVARKVIPPRTLPSLAPAGLSRVSAKLPSLNLGLESRTRSRSRGDSAHARSASAQSVMFVPPPPGAPPPGHALLPLIADSEDAMEEKTPPAPQRAEDVPALAKYIVMRTDGMALPSVVTEMRMDGVHPNLIKLFKGEGDAVVSGRKKSEAKEMESATICGSFAPSIDLGLAKFKKYNMMKKMGMPMVSIVHKMRADGCTQEEMDMMEGITRTRKMTVTKAGSSQRAEQHLEVCERLGLCPIPERKPTRVKKLKKIHWEVISPEKVQGTIWQQINSGTAESSVKLAPSFELEFQVRQTKPRHLLQRAAAGGAVAGGRGAKKKKGETVKWLDAKRRQRLLIGITKFRLDKAERMDTFFDAMRDADGGFFDEKYDPEEDCDHNRVVSEALSTLLELLPTPEEGADCEEKAEEYCDLQVDFGKAEMFWLEMAGIPSVKKRTELWNFSLTYGDFYNDRQIQVSYTLKALRAIKHSKALPRVLKVVLAMGNTMNHDCSKQQAFGFNLRGLELMDGIKTLSGRLNLTCVLYKFLSKYHSGTVEEFLREMEPLKPAARIETAMVEMAIEQMRDKFKEMDSLCRNLREEYMAEDVSEFCDYMEWFSDHTMAKMANLGVSIKNVHTLAAKVAGHLCFDLEKGKPESLVKVVFSFVESIKDAGHKLKKLDSDKLKKEARRRREREKKRKRVRTHSRLDEGGVASDLPMPPPSQRRLKFSERVQLEEDEAYALKNDLLASVAKFRGRQQSLADGLTTRFKEQKALAGGRVPESVARDSRKRMSITGRLPEMFKAAEPELAKLSEDPLEEDEKEEEGAGDGPQECEV